MKTPDRRQACSGAFEQLYLIDPPPFSPKWPKRTSLACRALTALLHGEKLRHPDFEFLTGSWRLAEPIRQLREAGWPVETIEVLCPSTENPNRIIGEYIMPAWAIDAVEVKHD